MIQSGLLALLFLIFGTYLLLCKDIRFVQQFCRHFTHFTPEELSVFLGSGLCGIGLSVIVCIAGSALKKMWLLYLGIGLMHIVLIMLFIVERHYKKRRRSK